MGAQNFNFASKFLQGGGFQATNFCIFGRKLSGNNIF